MTGIRNSNPERLRAAARAILKDESLNFQLIPAIALKLVRSTFESDPDIRELSKIIETDPAMATKVLQVINSAAFGLPVKVTSIGRAVTMMGVQEVRRIALTMLLFSRMIESKSGQFNYLNFWQHCLFVAELSRRIAVVRQHPDPDRVYSAGLLHDIGKLALEIHGKLSYSQFFESLNNSMHPQLEEEEHFFGITHSDLGLALCYEWKLPTSIAAAIAHHHYLPGPQSHFYPYRTEIAIVAFANYIAWLQGICSTPHEGFPELSAAVFDLLDVESLPLDSLLQQADNAMRAAREFYSLEFPDSYRMRARLLQSSISMIRIRHEGDRFPATMRNITGSLTAPHQSLEPSDFVPLTLESLIRDFQFDHVVLFRIDPLRRHLASVNAFPNIGELPLVIEIGNLSGKLLDCLREKKGVLIKASEEPVNPLIRTLGAEEFIAVPVLIHRRIAGLLYADYRFSRKPLADSILKEIGAVAEQLGIALKNARHYEMQRAEAQTDPLTRLYNRRMLEYSLSGIFQKPVEELSNLAVGFVDIDRFKQFNDLYGHQTGDRIIRFVADMLKRLTRPGDLVGRFGGEEFLFVLTDTNEQSARGFAERIRAEIARRGETMKPRFGDLDLTVSIGVAMYQPQFVDYSELIEAADQAMYQAKTSGRNLVVMFEDLGTDFPLDRE